MEWFTKTGWYLRSTLRTTGGISTGVQKVDLEAKDGVKSSAFAEDKTTVVSLEDIYRKERGKKAKQGLKFFW